MHTLQIQARVLRISPEQLISSASVSPNLCRQGCQSFSE